MLHLHFKFYLLGALVIILAFTVIFLAEEVLGIFSCNQQNGKSMNFVNHQKLVFKVGFVFTAFYFERDEIIGHLSTAWSCTSYSKAVS